MTEGDPRYPQTKIWTLFKSRSSKYFPGRGGGGGVKILLVPGGGRGHKAFFLNSNFIHFLSYLSLLFSILRLSIKRQFPLPKIKYGLPLYINRPHLFLRTFRLTLHKTTNYSWRCRVTAGVHGRKILSCSWKWLQRCAFACILHASTKLYIYYIKDIIIFLSETLNNQ